MPQEVLVLKCELNPSNRLQTYRHFKALISVCREISRVEINELPDEVRRKLIPRGELTIVKPGNDLLRVFGVSELREGVEYVRLIVIESPATK